jgi:hypothetical protein
VKPLSFPLKKQVALNETERRHLWPSLCAIEVRDSAPALRPLHPLLCRRSDTLNTEQRVCRYDFSMIRALYSHLRAVSEFFSGTFCDRAVTQLPPLKVQSSFRG